MLIQKFVGAYIVVLVQHRASMSYPWGILVCLCNSLCLLLPVASEIGLVSAHNLNSKYRNIPNYIDIKDKLKAPHLLR